MCIQLGTWIHNHLTWVLITWIHQVTLSRWNNSQSNKRLVPRLQQYKFIMLVQRREAHCTVANVQVVLKKHKRIRDIQTWRPHASSAAEQCFYSGFAWNADRQVSEPPWCDRKKSMKCGQGTFLYIRRAWARWAPAWSAFLGTCRRYTICRLWTNIRVATT
jgi:hypothetical protein